MPEIAAVVLAAGEGKRLRPLTALRPKALCPVDNVTLLDRALDRVTALSGRPVSGEWVAVNAFHHADAIVAAAAGRVHVSVEPPPEALGTAGALGFLRPWLAGRATLVANADAYLAGPLPPLVAGWDGERIRLLVVDDPSRADFHGRFRYAGAALMPWGDIRGLAGVPSGLYEVSWREALADGRVEFVRFDGVFLDCGTPADYLRANLHASGGRSVVGDGAVVDGELVRSVVWPGGVVAAGERLVESIRAGDLTVSAPLSEQG